jgi:hypothetical protein
MDANVDANNVDAEATMATRTVCIGSSERERVRDHLGAPDTRRNGHLLGTADLESIAEQLALSPRLKRR